ncbi:hypothetical protein FOZ62_028422, partial [Perkinsus olseni]
MPVDLLEAGPRFLTSSSFDLRHALDRAMGSAFESSLAAHNALTTSRYVDHMLRAMTKLLPTKIAGHQVDYSGLLAQASSNQIPPRPLSTDYNDVAHEFIAYKPTSSVDISSMPRLAAKLAPQQEPLTLNWTPYEEKHPDLLPRHEYGAFDAGNYHIDVGKPWRIRREIIRRRYHPFSGRQYATAHPMRLS